MYLNLKLGELNLLKMLTEIKISSLNMCLGIQAKKKIVKQTVLHEEIDIMSMQETEIIAGACK